MIGAVIRLNSVKRLDLLLRAASKLEQDGLPVTVLLVGDGPERHRLNMLAKELRLDLRVFALYTAEALELCTTKSTSRWCQQHLA